MTQNHTDMAQNARSLTLTELDRVNGGGGTPADAKAVQTALPLRASGRMQTLGEMLAALTNDWSALFH